MLKKKINKKNIEFISNEDLFQDPLLQETLHFVKQVWYMSWFERMLDLHILKTY